MTKRADRPFRAEYVSWLRMAAMASRLALIINKGDFRPELIVAIARGGFVPARILCDQLGISELASLRIVHYRAGGAKEKQARLVAPLNVPVAGKKVLLVDDLIDSGDTLKVALTHLRSLRPLDVKTAVMLVKPAAAVQPDFVAHRFRVWRWMVFPWAAVEDIGAFAGQLRPQPGSARQLQLALKQQLGLEIPRPLARDILQSILKK